MRFQRLVIFGVVSVLVHVGARLNAIEIGDSAPPLKVQEWIYRDLKGNPVNLSDGKGSKVYIVDFFATWCPPCVASIPDLTRLQREHADEGLVVAAICTDEDDGNGSRLKALKALADRMGDKMRYAIAIDQEEQTYKAYMGAFNVTIPHAFIINREGRIAWHGNPYDETFEPTVKAVMAGTHDIRDAIREKDAWGAAWRYTQALEKGEYSTDQARAFGEEVIEKGSDYSQILTYLGRNIVTIEDPKIERDLELAGRLATRARELTESQSAEVLELCARVHHLKGEDELAIETVKAALSHVGENERHRADLEALLLEYEATGSTRASAETEASSSR